MNSEPFDCYTIKVSTVQFLFLLYSLLLLIKLLNVQYFLVTESACMMLGVLTAVDTRRLSICYVVGCVRSPRSTTTSLARGTLLMPSDSNFKSIGY